VPVGAPLHDRRILVGVGGGIAAFKAAALVSQLVQQGARVRVAMTAAAREFVGPTTFAGLSGRPVIVATTQIDPDGSLPHLTAAKEAECYVVAPVTADLLARLAAGLADDPVSLLALCCRCPRLLCPAMNDVMWLSERVRRNAEALRAAGFEMMGPVHGHLAEGYDAAGRMVEPDDVVRAIAAAVRRAGS
jgi:phosphopantothenoylcysteine decarboxylase/phosphopantothenate--cysteine ligase